MSDIAYLQKVAAWHADRLTAMRKTFGIAAAGWLLISGALLLPAQSRPTYNIGKPTILAFFSPLSPSHPKEAAADEALADFKFYGQQALKPLAAMGIDYKEVYASGFVVRVGDATTTFSAS